MHGAQRDVEGTKVKWGVVRSPMAAEVKYRLDPPHSFGAGSAAFIVYRRRHRVSNYCN